MRSVGEHFCRNDISSILFYNPKFAPAFERIFGEPLKIYHGLSFFFLRAFFFFLLRKKEEKREN